MDTKNTPRSKPHEVTHENVSPLDAPLPLSLRQARQKRVDEYESQGLATQELDASFLTVAQADLLRVACVLEDEAKQTLKGCRTSETLADVHPAIHRFLAATRRIARCAELEVRAKLSQ